MPGYKGHLSGGLLTFIIVLLCIPHRYITLARVFEWLACTLIGALFPDIDIKSKGQKLYYRVLGGVAIVFVLQRRVSALFVLAFMGCFPLMCTHRGLCHAPVFLCGTGLLLVLVTYMKMPMYTMIVAWDALFFVAGALSHVFLDRGYRHVLPVKW